MIGCESTRPRHGAGGAELKHNPPEDKMQLTIEVSEKTMDYLRKCAKTPEAMASAIVEDRAERFGDLRREYVPSFLDGRKPA